MELIRLSQDATAEEKRERGKSYVLKKDATLEEIRYGEDLLWEAHKEGDSEACYWVAVWLLDGYYTLKNDDPIEYALYLLAKAANNGDRSALVQLNDYCQQRYAEQIKEPSLADGPLVDFSGKRIRISRTGIRTPVDVTLAYKDGQNVLTIRTNVKFLYADDLPDRFLFETAVREGFLEWAGDYTVFGGQKLTVRVEVTQKPRFWDNLLVLPVTPSRWKRWLKKAKSEEEKNDILQYVQCKRSRAVLGKKEWTAYSPKMIYMQFKEDRYDDYERIKHTAKHEFGHVLGLGDLYCEPEKGMPGVEKGTYMELDSYFLYDKVYNLVMHNNGPISNNDIEMVVLAFQENRFQEFQTIGDREASSALGKGN